MRKMQQFLAFSSQNNREHMDRLGIKKYVSMAFKVYKSIKGNGLRVTLIKVKNKLR